MPSCAQLSTHSCTQKLARYITFLLLGLFFLSSAFAQDGLVPIPELKSRVTDLTSTLTPEQQSSLEQTLQQFEARKGSQIAVLIVPSTQPEAIEQFSLRVVEQWQLGRKKVDDGVLFLIAKEDRRMRIEVGYGLEGGLNDAVAKRIIAEIVTPSFKGGDFFGGIQAGVAAIVRVVDGETLPEPTAADNQGFGGDSFSDAFVGLLFGAVFVGNFLRSLLGPLIAGVLTAVVLVPVIWFLQGSLIVSLIAGAFAGLLVLIGVRSGGGGAGGSRGGSGSGRSYGGGGGRFGGGGASGGW
jgi:uncharacterized protein